MLRISTEAFSHVVTSNSFEALRRLDGGDSSNQVS
uniref:Uncharacterized protein n=1 Tax=Nelumbo nucifera TaxID=4432 RepID=A0A822YJX2_NELNU|nr:TPA_asm: hypothetical protein HUJ06_011658 [Nelumbo nucifera]